VIFLCGIPSEPSLGLVIERLGQMEAPHVVFHQRRFAEAAIELEIDRGTIGGHLRVNGDRHPLESFTAVYTRLMDYNLLPEIEGLAADAPARVFCHNLHRALIQWYEIAPGRVLNRSHETASNYSKPFQAQLIEVAGFKTPETLVTNDADAVRDFRARHGRVIYKSSSSVRSIVKLLDDKDMERIADLRVCPVQFQEYVEGYNLRVHTVGERVFPTRITASAVDYRYAYQEGEREKLDAVEIVDELAERCVVLAGSLGLEFAGIDLRVTPDGDVYCLEVNPSPAFSYYELHTGQPISRAVAEYLAASSN